MSEVLNLWYPLHEGDELRAAFIIKHVKEGGNELILSATTFINTADGALTLLIVVPITTNPVEIFHLGILVGTIETAPIDKLIKIDIEDAEEGN